MSEAFARASGADFLSRMLYVDRHNFLGEGVLAKVDRMSMAHSLEVRSPLLDHRVVELAARIPSRLKLEGSMGKVCLRRLASKRLPSQVVNAPKSGFSPPMAAWIRGPLRAPMETTVLDPDGWLAGFLDPAGSRRLFEEHVSGRRNHARQLWLLYVLETWARNQNVGELP